MSPEQLEAMSLQEIKGLILDQLDIMEGCRMNIQVLRQYQAKKSNSENPQNVIQPKEEMPGNI